MATGLSATRPLIGVTTSEVRYAERIAQTPQSDPPRREMTLGLTYLRGSQVFDGTNVAEPGTGRFVRPEWKH